MGKKGAGKGRAGASKHDEVPPGYVEEVPLDAKDAVEVEKAGGVRETPSGLQYVDVRVGKGPTPESGQTVFCKYKGMLDPSGKTFDAGKLNFHIGRGEVIAGMDEGVKGMRHGGVRKLRIPPHLGYGSRGAGDGKIPQNATLIFDVQVLRIGSRKKVKEDEEEEEWAKLGGGKGIETGKRVGSTLKTASEEGKLAKKKATEKYRKMYCEDDEDLGKASRFGKGKKGGGGDSKRKAEAGAGRGDGGNRKRPNNKRAKLTGDKSRGGKS